MKKLVIVLVLAAAVAFAIWFGRRNGSPRISSATVTSLLPNDTMGFIHVPDVRDARNQWHDSDLYKLWREPAVQDFLQKPLSENNQPGLVSEKFSQLDQLGIRDAFLAVLPSNSDRQVFAGGFRFEGKRDDVERAIGDWRTRAEAAGGAPHRETVNYQQHQIDVTSEGAVTVASVYNGDWFFAASELSALERILDRVDRRVTDSATLGADAKFTAAFRHMPHRYIAFGYAHLEPYFEKLAAMSVDPGVRARLPFLRKVQSAAAAIGFENGKMRDVLFVAMPKIADQPELTRASLSLTNPDSLFYAATFVDFPQMLTPETTKASGVPAAMQGFLADFANSGVTADDWKSAFGTELGVIGNWPASARIPGVVLTLPVKDAAKARQVVQALTVGTRGVDSGWTLSDKGGVQFYFQAPSSPMLPIAASVAVSDRLLVAGLDPMSVEAAMTGNAPGNGALANSQNFRAAERLISAPKSGFAYVDTALFYVRLDAAIRPMLVMAAAFMPSMVGGIDVNKLPPPEAVTKHLSPIVLSQNYDNDGYITESVGPVSLFEAGVGIAGAVIAGTQFYQHQMLPAAPSPTPAGP